MSAATLIETLRARWIRAGYPNYAWWIPVAMDSWAVAAGVVAVVQRVGDQPLLPVTALAAVGVAPWLVALAGWRVPWPVFTALAVGSSTTLFVVYPVDYDFALFLLVMLAGHLSATESLWRSTAGVAVPIAVLVALDVQSSFSGAIFWLVALDIGWDVGFVMQYQQRRLEHQQRVQADREARAVVEERQRIAREVHDVIAHSMTVTMLHLTAARHTLEQGDEQDLPDALAALRDAELSGRQAMKDIRRTVGLMSAGSTTSAPAPGVPEIAGLVDDFRAAGLQVDYELLGDAAAVSPSSGLAVYRIMQESLGNVAKHAPRASVRAKVDLTTRPHRVTVWNSLGESTVATTANDGSGLKGMSRRAELLGGVFWAGRRDSGWLVQVELP